MRHESVQHIAVPAHVVWPFIADYANDPRFRKRVEWTRQDRPGLAVDGMRTVERLNFTGMAFETQSERRNVVPGRSLEYVPIDAAWTGYGWRSVEPDGDDGCIVRMGIELEGLGPLRLMGPAIDAAYGRLMDEDSAELKRVLEALYSAGELVPVPAE